MWIKQNFFYVFCAVLLSLCVAFPAKPQDLSPLQTALSLLAQAELLLTQAQAECSKVLTESLQLKQTLKQQSAERMSERQSALNKLELSETALLESKTELAQASSLLDVAKKESEATSKQLTDKTAEAIKEQTLRNLYEKLFIFTLIAALLFLGLLIAVLKFKLKLPF